MVKWEGVEGMIIEDLFPPNREEGTTWLDHNDKPVCAKLNEFLEKTFSGVDINGEDHSYEIEIQFSSKGYSCPATFNDPPEGEEERTVTAATVYCDSTNAISVPKSLLKWIASSYEEEIDDAELDYYEV